MQESESKSDEMNPVVARVVRALEAPSTLLARNEFWEEVTFCRGGDKHIFFDGQIPELYVIRGSQMYRLVAVPELPPVDAAKSAMR